MLSRSIVKRVSNQERQQIKLGALTVLFATSSVSYWNYRQYLKKQLLRSEGHYRLSNDVKNMTPYD